MTDLAFLSATELSLLIETGDVDPRDLTRLFLDRTNIEGRSLNCFITLCDESARVEASAAAERARSKRRLSPLDGIPVAVKDNMDIAGVPTSNGFGGVPLPHPIRRFRSGPSSACSGGHHSRQAHYARGCAWGDERQCSFWPRDEPTSRRAFTRRFERGIGSGCRGGAVRAALGSDTGGSIRIPASYCGTVGLKPSYGLVSTRGVVPLSFGLDHVGPLTRTVEDAAMLLDVLAGFDAACTESRRGPIGYAKPKSGRLDGVKLGVLGNFESEKHDVAIVPAFDKALKELTRLGAEIRSTTLPSYDPIKGRRAGFLRVEVEAAFVHGDLYRSEPERFSQQMRYYLDYGAKVSGTQLVRADRRITTAAFELNKCFDEVDAIVSPATPHAAPAFGRDMPDNAGTYCILANFAGAPAISVPMGRDEKGLPLGLQFIGPVHQDARILDIAAAYQAATGLQVFPPPPIGPSILARNANNG